MIYFIMCSIIWGLTWFAIKLQFHAVDASASVFYRFIIASLILFAFTKIKKIPLRYSREDHLSFLAQGAFLFCLNYIITYWASTMAPSALVALAFTSLIFFNLFGGNLFLNLPIEKNVFWGAFISFSGMLLITYNEVNTLSLYPHSLMGFLLSLLATVSASAGNLISLKNRRKKISIAANNAYGMLYGSLLTLIFCFLAQRPMHITSFDSQFLLSFAFLTLFGTVIGFGAYLRLIETMGPSKAAFTSVISPIIAFAVSVYFENLAVTVFLFLGMILSIGGNILALSSNFKLKVKSYVS